MCSPPRESILGASQNGQTLNQVKPQLCKLPVTWFFQLYQQAPLAEHTASHLPIPSFVELGDGSIYPACTSRQCTVSLAFTWLDFDDSK